MKVELKPSEYSLAVQVTSARIYVNQGHGVAEMQMGKDDPFKIFLDGLVAELAVCKHFNVCPDLSFEPRSGGHDCIIKDKRVDVKSTKPGRKYVYLPERKKDNPIDIYIWCYVDFRTVDILGYFQPSDIFVDENLEQSPRPNERHYKIDLETIKAFKHGT